MSKLLKLPKLNISFIGGGAMATALSKGLISSDVLPSDSIFTVSDPFKSQLLKISNIIKDAQKKTKNNIIFRTTTNNNESILNADIIFLAVKPQYLDDVLKGISKTIKSDQLIVSIVAGKTINNIRTILNNKFQKIIRVMPNTPSLVNEMAAGLVKDNNSTKNDVNIVIKLLGKLGLIFELHNESLLDAVTGLSGSGPAYIFVLIEALSDGGVKQGLPRDIATKLAAQTVLGAAKMVLTTGKHTGQLKDMVTSPKGTTITGLAELEKNNFRYAIIKAVEAATKRCVELSKL